MSMESDVVGDGGTGAAEHAASGEIEADRLVVDQRAPRQSAPAAAGRYGTAARV